MPADPTTPPPTRASRPEWRSLILGVLVSAACCGGCVSKSELNNRVRMAYLAGQRDAAMQMQAGAVQGPSVTFVGPVNNHVVKWTEGLTLSQAILKAVYSSPTDPATILVHRAGQNIESSPNQLLEGRDVPLQPGDVVEIR
jgi:hypothetical protein